MLITDLTGNDLHEMEDLKKFLFKYIHIKDLNDLKLLLDIEFSRSKKVIFILKERMH